MTPTAPRPKIRYPDSDGQPMADNTRQYREIEKIYGGMQTLFADRPDVFVAADNLWYPVEGEPTIRQAPDVYIVFGRPKGDRGSYKQWEEGGIPLTVVFEVLSPGNRYGEMIKKFQFYERYGVEEYYIYDPDRGELHGFVRQNGELVEVAEMQGFQSPRTGVTFELIDGELVLTGPDGERFLTYEELAERSKEIARRAAEEARRAEEEGRRAEEERLARVQAQQRAIREQQRADHEQQRADQAERQLAILRDKLRSLGVESD